MCIIDENNYNKAVNAMENMRTTKAKSMADRDKLQEQVNRSQHVVFGLRGKEG